MVKLFSRRRFLITGLGALGAGSAWADAPEISLKPRARGSDLLKRFQPEPEDLIARARLDGDVGYVVLRSVDGAVLEARHPDTGLPPASVAKALTACYALETLGPDHRFATRVMVDGKVENGRLIGNLVLAGGGDPTLDTDGLAALAKKLKEAGIFEVTGNFLVWGGALPFSPEIDPEQPAQVGYNPAVSGLNLNFNRVHFEWRQAGADYTVTMDARSAAHRPDVRVARMSVVARDVPVYTYSDANGRDNWTVARGALGSGGARWLPVRKPETYAAEVFQTFARSHGIDLKAPVIVSDLPEGVELARVESAPLAELLEDMLKYSTNLTAEIVGMAATAARVGAPESIATSARAMNSWMETSLGLGDIALVDHSGLGDRSRVSAQTMAKALHILRQRLGIKGLMKGFAMYDENGKRVEDHPITVSAKTGTLNFVSGLAGFADFPDGNEVTFAIFCADLARRATLSEAERERPEGGAAWNRRAKSLQQALIERWGIMYSA